MFRTIQNMYRDVWNAYVISFKSSIEDTIKEAKKQKEDKMSDYDSTAHARRRLYARLDDLFYAKRRQLKIKYAVIDMDPPASAEEFVERVKNGLFVFDDQQEFCGDASSFDWRYSIRWRDPNKPADNKGFDAALKTLEEEYNNTRDEVAVLDPVEGLKALRKFRDLEI